MIKKKKNISEMFFPPTNHHAIYIWLIFNYYAQMNIINLSIWWSVSATPHKSQTTVNWNKEKLDIWAKWGNEENSGVSVVSTQPSNRRTVTVTDFNDSTKYNKKNFEQQQCHKIIVKPINLFTFHFHFNSKKKECK